MSDIPQALFRAPTGDKFDAEKVKQLCDDVCSKTSGLDECLWELEQRFQGEGMIETPGSGSCCIIQ